jgi:hypothetical protein
MVAGSAAQLQCFLEAGGRVGQVASASVCSGESDEAVDLTWGVRQLNENLAAAHGEVDRFCKATLIAAKVAETA